MRPLPIALAMLVASALPLVAQDPGGLTGNVVDASNERPVAGADVRLDAGRYHTTTDSAGNYILRNIPPGVHSLQVTFPGFHPSERDGIAIRPGEVTRADVRLAPFAVQLESLTAVGVQDPITDPLATATEQHISAEELRRLPITTLNDAIALQVGVVGQSYRGGRPGDQAYVLDGFGIKNQFDASTNSTGLQIPPDLITEASLVTNAFSARYGQAISGLINVTTRDGGDHWQGRAAYETDRPLTGAADLGIDRFVFEADGPVYGRTTAVAVLDLNGQLDGDPVNAPRPDNPLDPRYTTPGPLPHNSAETWSGGLKFTIPMGERVITRLFGLTTTAQHYLYDPHYKYDPNFAPASLTDGGLLTADLQLLAPNRIRRSALTGDIHVGYFDKSFSRGSVPAPDFAFGAFTGKRLKIQDIAAAKALDTISTRAAIPGFDVPQYADNTPYGVPAFFLSGASLGEISWNRFGELRTQADFTLAFASRANLLFGGMIAAQSVQTFQRIYAFEAVGTGDSVAPPTASKFSPTLSGAYVEGQVLFKDLAVTAGIRYDGFTPGAVLANTTLHARSAINPRIAVSAVLKGATMVMSFGKFSEPPDLQYLVDQAFADTLRTGRFRQGNPDLGFESASQFEASTRFRLPQSMSLKVNVYDKRLSGLVASVPINVNPDSSVFANADVGEVLGTEVILEWERRSGWAARLSGDIQRAQATVTDAFQLRNLVTVDPVSGDTIAAGRAQFPLDYDRRIALTGEVNGSLKEDFGPRLFGVRPLGALEIAFVGRYQSGLPYTKTNTAGDSIVGLINAERLPSQYDLDMLLRRPLQLGRARGSIYLDIRNLLSTVNEVSVRRDTGTPFASDTVINTMARAAYNANASAIPYESPRYRRYADKNGDGVIAGFDELFPLYQAAARDYVQPLFYYGPPRTVRFGIEWVF
jgi:Carboxypeptidase regulatory-like domain